MCFNEASVWSGTVDLEPWDWYDWYPGLADLKNTQSKLMSYREMRDHKFSM